MFLSLTHTLKILERIYYWNRRPIWEIVFNQFPLHLNTSTGKPQVFNCYNLNCETLTNKHKFPWTSSFLKQNVIYKSKISKVLEKVSFIILAQYFFFLATSKISVCHLKKPRFFFHRLTLKLLNIFPKHLPPLCKETNLLSSCNINQFRWV